MTLQSDDFEIMLYLLDPKFNVLINKMLQMLLLLSRVCLLLFLPSMSFFVACHSKCVLHETHQLRPA